MGSPWQAALPYHRKLPATFPEGVMWVFDSEYRLPRAERPKHNPNLRWGNAAAEYIQEVLFDAVADEFVVRAFRREKD